MSEDDPYTYPGTSVLRNRLEIRDASALERAEREHVTQRLMEGVPGGGFDLPHLQAIHGHLFQDVYDWAGQIRTVEISKGEQQFQPRQFIETGMADVHRRLQEAHYFEGASPDDFARGAGKIIGDVNYVHPFREGNGRTQLLYLEQLSERAGNSIDLEALSEPDWIEASKQAHAGRYAAMGQCIQEMMVYDKAQDQEAPTISDMEADAAEMHQELDRRIRDHDIER